MSVIDLSAEGLLLRVHEKLQQTSKERAHKSIKKRVRSLSCPVRVKEGQGNLGLLRRQGQVLGGQTPGRWAASFSMGLSPYHRTLQLLNVLMGC